MPIVLSLNYLQKEKKITMESGSMDLEKE